MRKIHTLWANSLDPFNEILAVLEVNVQVGYHVKRAILLTVLKLFAERVRGWS